MDRITLLSLPDQLKTQMSYDISNCASLVTWCSLDTEDVQERGGM